MLHNVNESDEKYGHGILKTDSRSIGIKRISAEFTINRGNCDIGKLDRSEGNKKCQ